MDSVGGPLGWIRSGDIERCLELSLCCWFWLSWLFNTAAKTWTIAEVFWVKILYARVLCTVVTEGWQGSVSKALEISFLRKHGMDNSVGGPFGWILSGEK